MAATADLAPGPVSHRARLASWIESAPIQRVVIALILFNAVTLGLETSVTAMARVGGLLLAVDRVILSLFVAELALRLYAHGPRFFRGAWNVFDFVIITVSLLPTTGALSVLRAFRVLRLLRLVSIVPRMRFVVESILKALPGLGAIALLLLLFFYVFAVMATKLFGPEFPRWFGTLGGSMFSLFQIMTLESWTSIAREVMAKYPYAWLFFLAFILVATFTVLNLFIAIIVNAMQAQQEDAIAHGQAPEDPALAELRLLRAEVAELRGLLAPRGGPGEHG